MQFDLRGRNLEAVMDFIFDHPVPTIMSETGWWWESEVNLDPEEYAANLIAIFRTPAVLRSRYTREQLEQGFWMLISRAEPGLDPILWNPDVPWSVRTALIQATVDLYEKFFAFDSLDTSAYMFWDGLAYGYCVPTRHPETDIEDRRVQEAMFSALTQILEIDSLSCQLAALHGLGHLRHPNTEKAIRTYLARNQKLAEDHRRFAVACITGDIQ
jgi:hypothetical protein